jgi:hypothetical protein
MKDPAIDYNPLTPPKDAPMNSMLFWYSALRSSANYSQTFHDLLMHRRDRIAGNSFIQPRIANDLTGHSSRRRWGASPNHITLTPQARQIARAINRGRGEGFPCGVTPIDCAADPTRTVMPASCLRGLSNDERQKVGCNEVNK